MELTLVDRAMLAGEQGEAARLAMRVLVAMGAVWQAERLLDIEAAHVDGCLYHGESGIDFAQRLLDGGARVRVPTTLNVGGIDLLHPELFAGGAERAARARRLMECYQAMGCQSIFTCAPYQSEARPRRGAQVAWAESNAIVFANSVLGARTNRYGDFLDICAALTGRVPAVGLHLDGNRRGEVVFELVDVPARLLESDVLYPLLGEHVGRACGLAVPVIVGLPAGASEDQLKALGAAAASSGAVALFHAVGRTPEAPTLEAALGGRPASAHHRVRTAELLAARARLATTGDGPINVVALGSPHFSLEEFARLVPLVAAAPPQAEVEFVVCTGRLVHARLAARGWLAELERLGVRVITDSCVVVAPLLRRQRGVLMTNSGKFAHYTPANLGLAVVFGSLEECVRSASAGVVVRDRELWG